MSSCKVDLSSSTGALEIRVRDSNLNTVAKGFGALRKDLRPGIYQIEYRAGDQIEQELVALRPNQSFEKHNIDLPFATPVPLEGTATSHEYYRDAVQSLSLNVWGGVQNDSGVMIFIRNSGAESDVPLPVEKVRSWRLLNSTLSPVQNFFQQIQIDSEHGWLGQSMALPAGGYIIQSFYENQVIQQAIWLSAGWITGLFISNTKRGPALALASIQMRRLEDGWPALIPQSQEVGRALELALSGLRESRAVLPPDQLMILLKGKFRDPILGIVGAHTMLLQGKPNKDLLVEVLENLEKLVPGHPDVNALRHMAARYGIETPTPLRFATWPPMFFLSYRGLLTSDADDFNVIPDNSLTETIAPTLLRTGSWTTWRILDFTVEVEGADFDTFVISAKMPSFYEKQLTIATQEPGVPHAASTRVERYLQEAVGVSGASALRDLLSPRKITQVALATGLPVSLTRRAIEHIDLTKIEISLNKSLDYSAEAEASY